MSRVLFYGVLRNRSDCVSGKYRVEIMLVSGVLWKQMMAEKPRKYRRWDECCNRGVGVI
jgi:hypothetical protein